MNIETSNAIASVLLCVFAATFVTGCDNKKVSGATGPGVEEAKAIAGPIYMKNLSHRATRQNRCTISSAFQVNQDRSRDNV